MSKLWARGLVVRRTSGCREQPQAEPYGPGLSELAEKRPLGVGPELVLFCTLEGRPLGRCSV